MLSIISLMLGLENSYPKSKRSTQFIWKKKMDQEHVDLDEAFDDCLDNDEHEEIIRE